MKSFLHRLYIVDQQTQFYIVVN